MSTGANRSGLFVDTGFLRDHITKLQNQKKIAEELYANVASIKSLSDPAIAYQYDKLLRDTEQIVDYFTRMSKSLAHIDDEAVRMSCMLGELIEKDSDNTLHVTSENFSL